MHPLTNDEHREILTKVRYIFDQLGPKHPAWGPESSVGKNAAGQERTVRDALADSLRKHGHIPPLP